MSAPPFTLSSAPGLYWLAEPALPAGYGIALLPAPGGAAPPDSISFAESWTAYPGLYLLTATRPATAGEAAFLASARALAGWLGPHARFAWSADTTGEMAAWGAQPLYVEQAPGAAAGTVAVPALLALGAYAVGVSAGVSVTLAADGFTLGGGPAVPFSFATPADRWTLSAPQAAGGGPATALVFAGAGAGCLRLDLALPQDPAGTGVDDYVRLDVGMRTAAGSDRADEAAAGLLRSLRYPLFDAVPAGGVSFAGSFDPARPLDAARTVLAFATAPAHGTHYRAPLGQPVTLTPQTGGASPAGLAFHRRPPSTLPVPGDDPLYLAPVGGFAVQVPGAAQLACGTSGYEYFQLSTANAAVLSFIPGQPAYAQGLVVPADAPPPAPPGEDGEGDPPETGVVLTGVATCPYGSVTPAGSATVDYYAQPRNGALHRVRGGGGALADYLEFLAVPSGAAGTGSAGAYPLLPYAGVAADDVPLCARMEAQVMSPLRHDTLSALGAPAGDGGTGAVAATPRGLLAGFGAGLATWQSLQLAAYGPGGGTGNATGTADAEPPPLELLFLGTALRGALLASELFLVVADAATLDAATDYNYWVTDAAMTDLRTLPPAQRPSEAVLTALDGARTPQAGKTAFVAYLGGILPQGWTAWQAVILQYCAYFELNVEGWRFRLSPTVWGVNADPLHPVIMIFKYATGTLRALASNPGAWTWPPAAGSAQDTAAVLAGIIADADQQVAAGTTGSPSPLDFFVRRVVDDPSWNGVLVLNAQVPLDDLPAELQGLAGGIDSTRFRAHHAGVSVSPVTVDGDAGTLALGATPLFGLIDYQDPEDIAQTYADFDFKVLLLRVLFQNSAIADFASRVELFINRLLGDTVTLTPSAHYNNLILDGSYQRTASGGHYVFATATPARFLSASAVVDSVQVDRAQFATLTGGDTVASRFSLWGAMRFRPLDAFDLFSFGPTPSQSVPQADGWLAYGNLGVDMTFQAADPAGKRAFAVDLGTVAFDGASSVPREQSFFRRFPLQLTGLIRGAPGTQPRDRGFMAVKTPLYQPALDEGWHALTFTVDMGTLGALAADAGLTMTLAAAWGPAGAQPGPAAVNVGLKLPGVQSIGQLLPVQGVLGLGFQSIDLDASPAPTGGPSYVMRLRRFYLRLLGWQFPPGQADVYLFGDPDTASLPAGGRRGALGWYAAYRKKE